MRDGTQAVRHAPALTADRRTRRYRGLRAVRLDVKRGTSSRAARDAPRSTPARTGLFSHRCVNSEHTPHTRLLGTNSARLGGGLGVNSTE